MPPGDRVRPVGPAGRPGLWFDLPVALLLLVCWMTIPLALAHLLTGLALTLSLVVHLCTRRTVFRRRSAVAVAVLLAAAGLTVLTGLLRWAGLPRELVFHAVPSYSLMALTLWHALRRRRALLARVRPRAGKSAQ